MAEEPPRPEEECESTEKRRRTADLAAVVSASLLLSEGDEEAKAALLRPAPAEKRLCFGGKGKCVEGTRSVTTFM